MFIINYFNLTLAANHKLFGNEMLTVRIELKATFDAMS